MWPLFILSITTLACILERIIFWTRFKKDANKISKYILRSYEDNDNSENLIGFLNSKDQNPYAKIALYISNLNTINIEEFNELIDAFLSRIDNNLNKYGNIFGLTINISPLLGLLGTILGLMNSFTFIDIGNVGTNAKEVTGGISEALVSTAFGLIIAIITIIFLSYFNNCRNKEMFLIEEFSLKLRSFYFKSYK